MHRAGPLWYDIFVKGWFATNRPMGCRSCGRNLPQIVMYIGRMGRAHRSHRWGAGAEHARWAMQRGGGVLSKGASQAAAQRGDHCEVDRASGAQRDHRFESCCDHHNCTAILIQCVSGLRCSSFLSKCRWHGLFRALLHESLTRCLHQKPRKMVSTGVEPSAPLHESFLTGALLHDCSGLSCKSGRRILGLFPSRRRKQNELIEAGFVPSALSRTLAPVIARQINRPHGQSSRESPRQGRTWALGGETRATPLQSSARCRCVKGCYFH